MKLHRSWFLSLTLLAACGGGSMSDLEGIYDIDTWTENLTSCDAEGDSVLETRADTAMFVKVENLLGQKFINVMTCTDLADCEEMAGDDDTIHLGGWGFVEGSDRDGWTNTWYSAFDNFDDDTKCDGTRHIDVLSSAVDGTVRVESRISAEVQFDKPDGIDDCWDIDDDDLAGYIGEPACGDLEVLTATFNEDLP